MVSNWPFDSSGKQKNVKQLVKHLKKVWQIVRYSVRLHAEHKSQAERRDLTWIGRYVHSSFAFPLHLQCCHCTVPFPLTFLVNKTLGQETNSIVSDLLSNKVMKWKTATSDAEMCSWGWIHEEGEIKKEVIFWIFRLKKSRAFHIDQNIDGYSVRSNALLKDSNPVLS